MIGVVRVPLARADERRRLEPVDARHVHVEEDEREVLLQQAAQRLGARPRGHQPQLGRRQDAVEDEEFLAAVIDHQHPDWTTRCHRATCTRRTDSSWSMSTGLAT